MSNISIKINLGSLIHGKTEVLDKNGNMQECLVVPINLNKIVKGNKGYYLDLVAWPYENKPENSKDTHYIKQSLSKEERESMSDEEKRNQKFFGNLIVWDQTNYVNEAKEFSSNSLPPSKNPDDLPF